jgi:hypothetical protein
MIPAPLRAIRAPTRISQTLRSAGYVFCVEPFKIAGRYIYALIEGKACDPK